MKTVTAYGAKDLRIDTQPDPFLCPDKVLVAIKSGGICGSDLHYYQHGGFGTVRLKEPMILGHEVAGQVIGVGANVQGLQDGQLVAVSPSRPCGVCRFCASGAPNHCLEMRFYGSAMPYPHIQGAFRQVLLADPAQCIPADDLTPAEAAMAEPLAVVLHAATQAGDLLGKRVLVTGCGPIGLLAVLVARAAGASEIVATDISDFTLSRARVIGADRALNVADYPDALADFTADKGHFDVQFECSGVAAALASAIPALRPGGTIVQLGLGGDMQIPMQALTAKELTLKGSFRFHAEFALAVHMMQSKRIDVRPLVTHTLPFDKAVDAFDLAADRGQAIKVQLAF